MIASLVLAVSLVLPAGGGVPADTLTLAWAYTAARDHHPFAGQAEVQDDLLRARLKKLDTVFMPSVAAGGQAVYHSEVADLPFSFPGVSTPSVPHDQYRVGVSLEQVVYDGGMVSGRRALERAGATAASLEAEVAVYGVRHQVETAWYGALLAEAGLVSLASHRANLEARLHQLEIARDQGAAMASDLDALRVELLRLEQREESARKARRSALDVLELLTGSTLGEGVTLSPKPEGAEPGSGRPESALFAAGREQLERSMDLARRADRPRVQSFGEVAVGRPPGLNLFEDQFQPFFSIGVRVSWPLWDWGGEVADVDAARSQQRLVDLQEDAFDRSVAIQSAAAIREILEYEALLDRDADIVALRGRLASTAARQLERGVITTTDYLIEANNELQARLDAREHRIRLEWARARHATIMGGQ